MSREDAIARAEAADDRARARRQCEADAEAAVAMFAAAGLTESAAQEGQGWKARNRSTDVAITRFRHTAGAVTNSDLLRALDASETSSTHHVESHEGSALLPSGLPSLEEFRAAMLVCKEVGHVWQWQGHTLRREDCHRPKLMRCIICFAECHPRCEATRSTQCAPCAEAHRKRVAYIGRSGAMDSPTGFMFVTLTAPGIEELPWDTSRCTHSDGVACSGSIGCRVEEDAVAEWNYRAPQQWSWFVTYLRRELKRYGITAEFFKTWETQDRGALHIHALIRLSAPMSRRTFRSKVQSCAIQWGFGRQVDVQHAQPGDDELVARKAGYVASYCTKSTDNPAASFVVSRIDETTGEIGRFLTHKGYRPWSQSRGYGETMRAIKLRQIQFARSADRSSPAEDDGTRATGGRLDLNSDIYTVEWLVGGPPSVESPVSV